MDESSWQPMSAAQRRRQRRLRSMLRHEQQTVRMALAAALHHSAGPREKVEKQQNGAPRGQKTAARAGEGEVHAQHDGLRAQKRPLPETRLGLPPEPEPQGAVATVGYVAAAGALLLAVPSLAGGDAIDDTSVHFLLEMALLSPEEVEQLRQAERRKLAREEKEEEEEKKKEKERQEFFARWTADYLNSLSQSSSSTSQRRRKKRKKKKLPKSGCRLFPLGCGRPCDLQRQVPAALRVLRVPRQNGGHSCCATETGTHSVLLVPGAVLGQGCCARVAQRQGYGQTVQKTVLVPQFAVHRRSTSLRAAEANPHGPACSESHRDSTVAVGHMVDALVVQVVPCLTGAHGSDSAENCGGAAVASRRFDISVVVQRQIPMVLFRTIEIPVATAAVVTSCSSSANCPSSAAPMCCGGVCAAMSCGKYFSPDGACDFAWDSAKPMNGTYTINFIQYPCR